MRVRTLVEVALLLAIGFILHSFFPPVLFGMKPDFSLAMLFTILILKRDIKVGILAAALTGIFTALTTGFPGGQVANIVDKLVTGMVVIIITRHLAERFNRGVYAGLIGFAGTFLSGIIFLSVASLFMGFSTKIFGLLAAVVLPAALLNTAITPLLVSSISSARKALVPLQETK